MEEAREKGKELQEARNNLLSMPMTGMEMTDDLPGLCVSHPLLLPAISKCRMLTIVRSIREASIYAPWRFVVWTNPPLDERV